ncbi:glutathione synthetase-like isoform X2 [Euwallacea fornicatus]|uniref:glutathione synthetase-like isoform X2 n=1 Tax=Euwallacea fornicatus TaxID=995702 RepID=UPI00338E0A97
MSYGFSFHSATCKIKSRNNSTYTINMSKARLPASVHISLEDEELRELVSKTKDWAVMNGIGIRSKVNFSEDSLTFAPFVLLPTAFPRKIFHKAVEIQTTLNELMHKVAHDEVFLRDALKVTIQVDEFTANLYKIWEEVLKEGINQPISLGLVRNDLMLDSLDTWKQVEFNTIAAGFGWLGPASLAINKFVLEELGHYDKLRNLPENNALAGIVTGLLEAWTIYSDPKAAILMIIEDVTYNICDQRFHEFELKKMNPEVKMIRRTLTEVHDRGRLSEDKQLVIDNFVVSVVYYRSGYSPVQYPTQNEWQARLLIEKSRAIKCPSIQYHLAGTKKVQQVLAMPGVLKRFVSDTKDLEHVRDIFAEMHALEFDELGEKAVQMAIDNPERFVLKPQREGGGNNIYSSEVREAILKMRDSKERTAWILMEKINSPISVGYMVRPGGPNPPPLVEMISELGIFGMIIGDYHKIMVNRQVGHMFRTKVSTANEGGVAAGSGALDSPYLIDL